MSKTFSIITPAFNSEKFIKLAIESVINTKYDLSLIEHIIVDDGSSDKTAEIVTEYAARYPHIKYFRKDNGHWGSVINFVVKNKIPKNDYVVIQDSDDVFLPNCFATVDKKIKNSNVFFTSFYFWNGKKRKIPCWPYFFVFKKTIKEKILTPTTVPLTVFITRKLFLKAPKLIEGRPYQDWILYPTLMSKAKKMGFTSVPCAKYWNSRPGNTMSNIPTTNNLNIMVENLQLLAKNDFHSLCVFYLLAFKPLLKHMQKYQVKIQTKSRPTLKWFPFYIRWIIYLKYKTSFDKFFVYPK